jgi:hypothetical protein
MSDTTNTTGAPKTRTITLTDRQPILIVEDDWPVIAEASDWQGEFRQQTPRSWDLYVRQNTVDGRTIVYGVYRTSWVNEHDARAGELLIRPGDVPVLENEWSIWPDIYAAIKRVADRIGCAPRVAQACIADLPAEAL